jgi:hypothetical protein
MSSRIATSLALMIFVAASGFAEDQEARELLDAVREDLVELRFEKALAGIAALLGDPSMSEAEKVEVLVLRAQAHVAFGDLDSAEQDYREILRLRPGYRPEPTLTPEKALKRYRKVRAEMVGQLRVVLSPADTRLRVDGRELLPEPDGSLPLLSGEHTILAERAGHDPFESVVVVEAGKEIALEVDLVPNARTVIVQTEPDGVEVFLDGEPVGTTSRPEPGHGTGQPAARLVIENVPLGDHLFELRKECHRTERVKDVVTVDLLDRTPKTYRSISMVPVSSTLALSGGPAGATVFVDGVSKGRLPLEPLQLCPGSRQIDLRLVGRTIWRSVEQLDETRQSTIAFAPRPNLVLVGPESWPAGLEPFGAQYSAVAMRPLPSDVDLSSAKGWSAMDLPDNTDLALAVVPTARDGTADRIYLYSPLLGAAERLDAAPGAHERPGWSKARWGVVVVDSRLTGPSVVADVTAGGPAAEIGLRPGTRILTVGGLETGNASEVMAALNTVPPGQPVEISWQTLAGEDGIGQLTAGATPVLQVDSNGFERDAVRAAWAVVDAIADPEAGPAALANLALLFGLYEHHEIAAETWRRVRFGERAGIGEGTKQYYLGRELERLGREEEAIVALRAAAAGAATAFDDDGPLVAPAARDRLADLGVAVSAP